MVRPLHEQVVVVTGASSGIGRATVAVSAKTGAQVVAAARHLDALEELERAAPDRVVAVPTDVTDRAAMHLERPQSPGSERGRVEGCVSSMKERSPFTELVWQRPGVRRALVGAGLATLGWAIAR